MPKLLKEKFKALDNLLTGFTELIESKYPLESKLILKDLVENSVINKYLDPEFDDEVNELYKHYSVFNTMAARFFLFCPTIFSY